MRLDRRAASAGPSFLEEDSNGWLVTFSDLVLQLFAFVLVAAVLGSASTPGPPSRPVTTSAPVAELAPARTAIPQAGAEVATRRLPDALSLARFDDLPQVPIPPTAPIAAERAAASRVPPGAAPVVAADPPREAVARAVVSAPAAADVAAPAPVSPVPVRSLATELEALVTEEGLGSAVHVAVKGGGVILSISDTIGFASGSAELLPDAGPVLDAVRALVAARPELVVEVSGHTDDRPLHAGAFRSNLDLSLARAARVAHELAADDPMLTSRVFAAGYGDARPVAPNDDAEGRARNRRVEVRLVPGRDAVS